MSFLGLDLGTSGLRALLVDEDGNAIASVERSYQTQSPHPGWSEQDPTLWTLALDSAMADLRRTTPEFASLKAISAAGHMHGATLLDEAHQVIRPCILWNDTRAHKEAAELDLDPDVQNALANTMFPGFTAPKLRWIETHEPENFKKIRKVVLPAAYLNTYLTGEPFADYSDSAGSGWLDVLQRCWSPTLLEAGHMRPEQMPRLVESTQAGGVVRPELARQWGLSDQVFVTGGAGDNAATACAMGITQNGQGLVSLGTSGVVLGAVDRPQPDPNSAVHTFCHAIPKQYYQMGVMLAATDSLNWLSDILLSDPAELTSELPKKLLAPGSTQFLPYLSGERTPHNSASLRGSWLGLSSRTTRTQMIHSVIEGVSFALKENLDALESCGQHLDSLWAVGGGAKSDYWLSLLATVMDRPLWRPEQGDFGAALGAARLSQVAAGLPIDEVMTAPRCQEIIEPLDGLRESYREAFHRFVAHSR